MKEKNCKNLEFWKFRKRDLEKHVNKVFTCKVTKFRLDTKICHKHKKIVVSIFIKKYI